MRDPVLSWGWICTFEFSGKENAAASFPQRGANRSLWADCTHPRQPLSLTHCVFMTLFPSEPRAQHQASSSLPLTLVCLVLTMTSFMVLTSSVVRGVGKGRGRLAIT